MSENDPILTTACYEELVKYYEKADRPSLLPKRANMNMVQTVTNTEVSVSRSVTARRDTSTPHPAPSQGGGEGPPGYTPEGHQAVLGRYSRWSGDPAATPSLDPGRA